MNLEPETQQSAPPSHAATHFNNYGIFKPQTTAWLAQLVQLQSAVWEVEGRAPDWTNTQDLKITEENMLSLYG